MAVILSRYVNVFVILTLFGIFNESSQKETFPNDTVKLLTNEPVIKQNAESFVIYCFDNVPKSFFQIWRSVQLLFENAPISYEIFTGENASEVHSKYVEQSMWSPSSWFMGQKTTIDFPVFSNYCVGIASKENYALFLKVRVVNYWKVLQTIIGVLLFLCAPSLSRNSFFHYTSGVSFGVIASLLILVYIMGRFIPRKSASYAVMVFGYSFILYILQVIWQHFNDIVSNYMDVLLIYCLFAAFVSFVVCYRLGPVQNVRTFNVIQWAMQAIGIILIYLGSEYREVSTASIIVLLTIYAIPVSWITRCQAIWYRFFPPKVRLLSEVEYIEQGSVETAKALEELRKFCRSPDCNTWKVVTQLKDPLRFSKFIDSGSHFTDEELLGYNSEGSDDEENEEPILSSDASNESVRTSQINYEGITPSRRTNGAARTSKNNHSFR